MPAFVALQRVHYDWSVVLCPRSIYNSLSPACTRVGNTYMGRLSHLGSMEKYTPDMFFFVKYTLVPDSKKL